MIKAIVNNLSDEQGNRPFVDWILGLTGKLANRQMGNTDYPQ